MIIQQRVAWILLIASAVYPMAAEYGIDGRIVMAQLFVESSYRSDVVNSGCFGLMQVSWAVWHKQLNLDRSRMLEPLYSIGKGLRILDIYNRQTGDIWKALKLYNSGFKGRDTGYADRVLTLAGKR